MMNAKVLLLSQGPHRSGSHASWHFLHLEDSKLVIEEIDS